MPSLFLLNEQLPTDLQKVNLFVERVSRNILSAIGNEQGIFDVKLALEEALTNAMRHGNALDQSLKVDVSIEVYPEKIIMDIRDEGKGFDFQNLPDPTDKSNVDKPSGRGVFLMRRVMDKVEFYGGGSGVKLTKFFPLCL
ncbi:MAG: ATP-binding protein [Elusimicrobiota bacterium]